MTSENPPSLVQLILQRGLPFGVIIISLQILVRYYLGDGDKAMLQTSGFWLERLLTLVVIAVVWGLYLRFKYNRSKK